MIPDLEYTTIPSESAAVSASAHHESIANRYEIEKELGVGGMGAVYLCRDLLHENRLVAVKQIKEALIDPQNLQSFTQEFEIMTRLSHPNLVRVYDFGFDPVRKAHFITMEYIDGISLKDMLRAGRIPVDQAVSILIHLCRAVSFIHSRKIIHHDINPNNILQTNSGTIKLMDFGLADLGGSDQRKKGTLQYMAPEIFAGKGDHRVDIFALGYTFCEMINNTPIYPEENSQYIVSTLLHLDRFKTHRTAMLDKIDDPAIRAVIDSMTAYNPDERYQSGTRIIDALNRGSAQAAPLETTETKEAYVLGAGFVGRGMELERFQGRIGKQGESFKALWVHGDAGVGKSRLFAEFKKYCQMHTIPFLEGSCSEHIHKQFGPFLPVIRELLFHTDETLIRQYGTVLKKMVPDHIALKDIFPAPDQDPRTEHMLAVRTIVDFIVAAGKKNPGFCVLYLNDMQWSDEGSIEVIDILLKKLLTEAMESTDPISRIYLYLSSRPEGNDVQARIKSRKQVEVIQLQPFNENSVCRYIEGIFGAEAIGAGLRSFIPDINRKVGGNPFYLQELIRSLVAHDVIVRTGESWDLRQSLETVELPIQLKDLVGSRMKQLDLSDHQERIIQILSLLDRTVSWEELNGIIPTDARFLDHLERHEILLSEYNNGRYAYRIAHDLIRDTVIRRITERAAVHEQIAIAIESIHAAEIERYVEELAHHYFHTDRYEKARFYLEQAADRAIRMYENDKAVALFDGLIPILEENDTETRIRILVKKAKLFWGVGKLELLITVCRQIIAHAEAIKDVDNATEGYYLLGASLIAVKDLSSVAALEKAYVLAESTGKKALCSKILMYLGHYYFDTLKDYEKAHEYLARSIVIGEEIGDIENINSSLGCCAQVFERQGNPAKAIEYSKKVIAFIESELEHPTSTLTPTALKRDHALMYGCIGMYYYKAGESESAIFCLEKGIAISEEGGITGILFFILGQKATALFDLGRMQEAKATVDRAEKILPEISDFQDIFVFKVIAAKVSYAMGDREAGRKGLTVLLEELSDVYAIAELHYELWLMDKKDTHRNEALGLYRGICAKTSDYIYKKRLDELETNSPANVSDAQKRQSLQQRFPQYFRHM